MAPSATTPSDGTGFASILKRDYCYDYPGSVRCSSWYYWGRWVLAGLALLLFFLFVMSLLSLARRRRARGAQPYYGTGWMAPVGKYGGPDGQNNSYPMHDYQNHQNGYYSNGPVHNPPPAYGTQAPQYTGTTFNPNDGYYGNQQYNGNVQQPQNTYHPDHTYPAPPPVPQNK
ncbi:unnamed protein product [Clonostachys byssicola]|uniref:Uncharacterized protein n=1 Tax=Clonostachys byssicola TaxID=160290 RepID=A0A9N9U2H2_9HYPO|nr:unnamed protein product [Clonostachys byssicola]